MSIVRLLRPLLLGIFGAACLSVGYVFGLHDAPPTGPQAGAGSGNLQLVSEALGQIQRDYYRRDALDQQKLAEGAARGLVEAVGDPYTTLSDPSRASQTDAELRGSFDGIGVQLERRDDRVRVLAALAGSPAEQAGIQPGDAIVAIDGQDASQMALADAVARLRGPRGSTVRLGLERDGQRVDVSLVRQSVGLRSVESRLLTDLGDARTGYVRVSLFAEPTAGQLRQALSDLSGAGARAVVLDLRGNPGGYLNSAVDVTSLFVRNGIVLYEQGGPNAQPTVYRTAGSPQTPDVPLAVLVDGGSASAAEIVAAALHDNGRAVLIGQKTFGKGSVQATHTLSDDSELHVTVAQWLTPSGKALQGQGLEPDVEVAAASDGGDAPLAAAVQYLSAQAAGPRG